MFNVGLELRWKWNTDITQLFKVYEMDQRWSYHWSQIFRINNNSAILIILLQEETDTLIDKRKKSCHDKNYFGVRNSKITWNGTVSLSCMQQVFMLRICNESREISVDTAQYWLQLEIK